VSPNIIRREPEEPSDAPTGEHAPVDQRVHGSARDTKEPCDLVGRPESLRPSWGRQLSPSCTPWGCLQVPPTRLRAPYPGRWVRDIQRYETCFIGATFP
jgi:hypothetical protein